jgi:site-specific DNA-methyltransferase (cytosine-N4-specific)
MSNKHYSHLNQVFFKNAQDMSEIPDKTVHLIVTSPPYFNIKDYAKDGFQEERMAESHSQQIGDINEYEEYISALVKIWQECERVLAPNGKLAINAPLMPMRRKDYDTHYNRHIFDLNADIEHSILKRTNLFLYDVFIWNRTNSSKRLMFGSYPYPRNFYAQNTSEFITIYVKDGKPNNDVGSKLKQKSKLTESEWREYTQQIWDIPIPSKDDLAFGKHSAIMPEEIVRRCIRLFTFAGDVVLDPMAGSGTTLKVAKELERNYIGYELMEVYKSVIEEKLSAAGQKELF